jgi:hypothetical protein
MPETLASAARPEEIQFGTWEHMFLPMEKHFEMEK